MTKYINKVTSTEMDYDQVCNAFEQTLVWDGETDPEEFLMEAYEFEFENWLLNQGIEEVEVPDPVKPKKVSECKSSKKKIKKLQIPEQAYEAYDAKDYKNNFYGMFTMNPPSVAEDVITGYGSEDGYRYFVEHNDTLSADNARFHYASFLIMNVNNQYQMND